MKIKTILQYTLLLSLTSWYGYQVAYGKNGLKTYYKLTEQLGKEQESVDTLNQEIAQLEHSIHLVKTDNFMKEKIAREELLLGYNNEYVYFIKPSAY